MTIQIIDPKPQCQGVVQASRNFGANTKTVATKFPAFKRGRQCRPIEVGCKGTDADEDWDWHGKARVTIFVCHRQHILGMKLSTTSQGFADAKDQLVLFHSFVLFAACLAHC